MNAKTLGIGGLIVGLALVLYEIFVIGMYLGPAPQVTPGKVGLALVVISIIILAWQVVKSKK